MSKQLPIGLVMLVLSSFSQAESGLAQLLGITPGSESPIPLASIAVPFTMERIPTENAALAKVFPDLQIFTLAPENKISAVAGRRAMANTSSCAAKRKEVLAILQHAFPSRYEGTSHEWQFQTTDGVFVAAVNCTRSGGNPFPLLEMQVAHLQTYEQHQNKLRSY